LNVRKQTLKSRVVDALAALDRRARIRAAIAVSGLLVAVTVLATCGACSGGWKPPAQVVTLADGAVLPKESAPDAAALRDPLLWGNAKGGEEEDLTTLATHEGAAGLLEAAGDPELRPVAIRAMGYARGWAQLPYLARAAGGKEDEEAQLALAAIVELAVRPRTAEDPEDADELQEGCKALLAMAREPKNARARRVPAVRALRMLPCPPAKEGEGIPADVDSK
jgi:hypothetical protein